MLLFTIRSSISTCQMLQHPLGKPPGLHCAASRPEGVRLVFDRLTPSLLPLWPDADGVLLVLQLFGVLSSGKEGLML